MVMKLNLFELVRDQHGAAATSFLGELLQQQPDQLRGNVDSSIGTVLDGFSTVAGDHGGRELLYEAIRYCDDTVVEDPAVMFRDRDSRDVFTESNNRLASLVGISNKKQMIETLQSRTNLEASDAENLLGYITPGVMGVLKRQIGKGDVLDNPDGIGQMFLGEGDINAVDTTKRKTTSQSGTAAAAAVAHEEGADHSWLFRYAMPALLLGGLVLGGLNNCSNRAENRVIADEQNKLQLELDGVTQEKMAALAQVETLQGEFDASKLQTADLTAQAEGLTVELDAAKGRVVELQGELETAKAEGEAARLEIEAAKAETAELNAQAESLTADLTDARTRVSSLETDLGSAREQSSALSGQVEQITAELTRVKDLPTETSELQSLLSSVTDERNASIDASAAVQAKLDAVIQERDLANDKISELQSGLDEALATSAAKDEELAKVDAIRAELDEVTIGRDDALGRNVEFKTANADLQQQLDSTTRQLTDVEARLRSSTEKVSELDANLANTTTMLDEEKSLRQADVNRLTGTSTDLQNQLANMLGMRDEAVNTLSLRDSEVTSLGEKVNALQDEVVSLEDANAKAREEAAMLQQKIDALNGDLEVTQGKVDEANSTLAEREESLVAVNGDLETARADIVTITAERDELLNKRDALASRVSELMAEKDAVIAETVELNGTIEGLTADLDAAKQAGMESDNKVGLLNESMTGLEKELKLITGARDEASDQAKKFRAEAGELKQGIAALESDLSKAQAAHDEALAAMQQERDNITAELGETKTTLGDEITALKEELGTTQGNLETATTDLAALNDEKAKALADIETLQAQASSLQGALDQETAEVGNLQAMVSELTSARDAVTQERDSSAEEAAMLAGKVDRLQGMLGREQSDIKTLNKFIAQLNSTKSSLTTERDDALGTIDSLQARLTDSDKEISMLSDARSTLQQQIDEAAQRAQDRVDETLSLREQVEAELAAAGIDSASVSAIEDDTAVAITLGSGDLYGVGSASLSRQGNELLGGVGQIVAAYPNWHIDVEGHTDSQGIGAELRKKYPTNWELSTARAAAAVRYLSSRAGIPEDNISARGFGDTQPLASNETAAGREQNRRVEIILRK